MSRSSSELDIHPRALRRVSQSLRLIDARAARGPRGQPPVPRNPDLAQGSGDGAAADERGRACSAASSPISAGSSRRCSTTCTIIYTVDEHTLFAIGILHQIESGRAQGRAAAGDGAGGDDRLAPRALSRGAAARHRQGARRRPFRARRADRAEARAAARPHRRGDRDRRLAGALAPVDERHRVQARHRRPADDPAILSSTCNRRSG